MPIKYYEIKDYLRKDSSIIDNLMRIIFKFYIVASLIMLFVSFSRADDVNTNIVVMIFILWIIYRMIIEFERLSIKNQAINLKKDKLLNEDQVEKLVNEIESSINKTNTFATWSCGLLATVTIFSFGFLMNTAKDIFITDEVMLELTNSGIDTLDLLLEVGSYLMFFLPLLLFAYYSLVQLFTYDRRVVNQVLKSSLYITEKDDIIEGWKAKTKYFVEKFLYLKL